MAAHLYRMAAARYGLILSVWGLVTLLLPPATGDVEMEAQENMAVTLSCPPAQSGYVQRSWFKGYFDNLTPSRPGDKIYNQLNSGAVNQGPRGDMTLNEDTFQLTINRLRLSDNSDFTCSTLTDSLKLVYHVVKLHVYVQPRLTITGLDKSIYRQHDRVIAVCAVRRIYPELDPAGFRMTWGDDDVNVTQTINRDATHRYRAERTRTLTKEDDGKVVTCAVDPVRGRTESFDKTLNVQYISMEAPLLTVDNQYPYRDNVITFRCERGDVTDNPRASVVSWYLDGRPLSAWPDDVTSHSVKVVPSDGGSYACRVGNVVGFSAVSEALQVNVSSRADPYMANVGAAVGGTLSVLVIILIIGALLYFFLVYRPKRKTGSTRRPAQKISRKEAGRLGISSPVSVQIVPSTTAELDGETRINKKAARPTSAPVDTSAVINRAPSGKPPGETRINKKAARPTSVPVDTSAVINRAPSGKPPALQGPTENVYENVQRHSAAL